LRNLPYETTEEELRELCAPFGTLVQTKLNVGPNKNQAFVEFPDVNSAQNMIQYYTSTAEPAKVSGRFLSFSPCNIHRPDLSVVPTGLLSLQ
jgi:RNA recognition motif-containing protein